MKILGLALVGLLLVVVAAMMWQHLRYVNKRRAVLQDHQPLLYPAEAFHALTSAYGNRMMDGMAEGGYGPMHMGPAVRVEGDHDFDTVLLVYYPGVEFFVDLMRSKFFQGIIGGKSLGDTQTNITVPILDRL